MAVLILALTCGVTGCATSSVEPAFRSEAHAILSLDADADWTSAFNRLAAEPPYDVIAWICSQPAMKRSAAPDDLETLLHTSLIRLLAGHAAPPLTLNCYETTFDLLHFDPRVDGRPLGEVCIPPGSNPRAWHDVYPHRVDQRLAERIDAEADRRRILGWCRTAAGTGQSDARRLNPQVDDVLPLLRRRYADCWLYETDRKAMLVAAGPPQLGPGTALMQVATNDYNLVRAACIWLGARQDGATQQQLIALIADDSPVVVHNTMFALRFSRDPRIRETIERYNSGTPDGP